MRSRLSVFNCTLFIPERLLREAYPLFQYAHVVSSRSTTTTTARLDAIKKSNEGYLIGVYRYTLHPLNGSRTHASVLFPAPTVIITDSQEGQMFRRCRRRRRRRRRQIAAVVDDGSEGFPINLYYVSVVGRVALGWFVLSHPVHPVHPVPPRRRYLTSPPPSSSGPTISGPNLYPSTYLHISCRPLFSLTGEPSILILVSFGGPFGGWTTGRGNEMDNRTAVRSRSASASHPTRAV